MVQGNAVGGWQGRVSGLAVADGKPSAPDVAQTTQDPNCVGVMCGLKFGFFFFFNLTESCCMEIFTKCMHINNK